MADANDAVIVFDTESSDMWDIVIRAGSRYFNIDYLGEYVRISGQVPRRNDYLDSFSFYADDVSLCFGDYKELEGNPNEIRDQIRKDPGSWLMEQFL